MDLYIFSNVERNSGGSKIPNYFSKTFLSVTSSEMSFQSKAVIVKETMTDEHVTIDKSKILIP